MVGWMQPESCGQWLYVWVLDLDLGNPRRDYRVEELFERSPGSVQDQVEWGPEHPDLVGSILDHNRGVGTK